MRFNFEAHAGRGVMQRILVFIVACCLASLSKGSEGAKRKDQSSTPSAKTLVVYNFLDSEPEAEQNLQLFLRNGVREDDTTADFIVVQSDGGTARHLLACAPVSCVEISGRASESLALLMALICARRLQKTLYQGMRMSSRSTWRPPATIWASWPGWYGASLCQASMPTLSC